MSYTDKTDYTGADRVDYRYPEAESALPEVEERLASLLWNLHVAPGVKPRGQRWNRREGHPGQARTLTPGDMVAHVRGKRYLYMRVVNSHRATCLVVDVDRDKGDESPPEAIPIEKMSLVAAKLSQRGYPFVISLSKRRGCHFTIPLSQPVSERRHIELVRTLLSMFRTTDGLADLIPTGGEYISLPCGLHPETNTRTGLLDPDTFETLGMDREIELLEAVERLPVGPKAPAPTPTDEGDPPEDPGEPRLHEHKECLNRIWRCGIPGPGTRHYASLAIVQAINGCHSIDRRGKEAAATGWVDRTYPMWVDNGYTRTSLDESVREIERLMKQPGAHFAPSCKGNSPSRYAMLAACTPEDRMRCMERDAMSVRELPKWMFVLHQAHPIWPMVGRARRDVYFAMWRMRDRERTHEGWPVVQQSQVSIASQANVHVNTVRDAIGRLMEYDLVRRVPADAIAPLRLNPGRAIAAYAVREADKDFLTELLRRP